MKQLFIIKNGRNADRLKKPAKKTKTGMDNFVEKYTEEELLKMIRTREMDANRYKVDREKWEEKKTEFEMEIQNLTQEGIDYPERQDDLLSRETELCERIGDCDVAINHLKYQISMADNAIYNLNFVLERKRAAKHTQMYPNEDELDTLVKVTRREEEIESKVGDKVRGETHSKLILDKLKETQKIWDAAAKGELSISPSKTVSADRAKN